MQPDKACLITVASVILHNISKILNEADFDGDDNADFKFDPLGPRVDSSDGKVVRDRISNTFFA